MRCLVVTAVLVGMVAAAAPAAADETWAQVLEPSPGPARAIGGYSQGCVAGAIELPLKGKGYRVAKPARRRFFGHPALVAFIRALGTQVTKKGLGVLMIGDLGQARGGPAPSGHASHQTGLDVDIWYTLSKKSRKPVSLVDLAKRAPTRHFGKPIVRLLALVAADPRVDRIFVNPVIKRALCKAAGKQRAWLAKVRPWWGHHDHFHVRLACPEDSPACEALPPVSGNDGCGDLDWWFREDAEEERAKRRGVYQARVGAAAALPEACLELLK